MNCLLLKTPDDRLFFTKLTNLPLLVEFAKTHNIEISTVRTSARVLNIKELVKSICTKTPVKTPKYKTLKVNLSTKQYKSVYNYVKDSFLKGETVSLSFLVNKFPEYSKSTLNSYLSKAKKELTQAGYSIQKIKKGHYLICGDSKKTNPSIKQTVEAD